MPLTSDTRLAENAAMWMFLDGDTSIHPLNTRAAVGAPHAAISTHYPTHSMATRSIECWKMASSIAPQINFWTHAR